MYISRFAVFNYKSLAETPTTELNQGMNVVVGQNNAGKTALLEALELNTDTRGMPHRSVSSMPRRDTQINPLSTVAVDLVFSNDEVLSALANARTGILIPLPMVGQSFGNNSLTDYSTQSLEVF